MKQPIVVQKIQNHGVSHPIVARLAIQTLDLVQWLDVDDLTKKKVIDNFLDLQNRLLSCFDIQQRLIAAKKRTLTEQLPADAGRFPF